MDENLGFPPTYSSLFFSYYVFFITRLSINLPRLQQR